MSTVADISAALPSTVEFNIAQVRYISRHQSGRGFDPEAKDDVKRLPSPDVSHSTR